MPPADLEDRDAIRVHIGNDCVSRYPRVYMMHSRSELAAYCDDADDPTRIERIAIIDDYSPTLDVDDIESYPDELLADALAHITPDPNIGGRPDEDCEHC